MKRKIVILTSLTVMIGFGQLAVYACMCPGVNPEIYPPDVEKSRVYYKEEFNGAAFTGKVLSSRVSDVVHEGKNIQELTIEVERHWFGVKKRNMTIYVPKDGTGCWLPFSENESYFFIPSLENGRLHISVCAYSTFNRKQDGNYVAFMVKMFGTGKRFAAKK